MICISFIHEKLTCDITMFLLELPIDEEATIKISRKFEKVRRNLPNLS